jgi:hypothetical protein
MTAPLDRRDFLRTTGGTLGLLLSRSGLSAAQTPSTESPPSPPVTVGVVGLGAWGREILAGLGRTPATRVDCICDTCEPFLKRGSASAPRAQRTTDWRRVIDATTIEAVVVATPTDAHRETAVAALEAGKHVYCEAPLASSIDDARAIARAARNASRTVFQAGLRGRSNAYRDPDALAAVPRVRCGCRLKFKTPAGQHTGHDGHKGRQSHRAFLWCPWCRSAQRTPDLPSSRSAGRKLLQRLEQRRNLHRLDEKRVESGGSSGSPVLVAAVAGQRDQAHRSAASA